SAGSGNRQTPGALADPAPQGTAPGPRLRWATHPPFPAPVGGLGYPVAPAGLGPDPVLAGWTGHPVRHDRHRGALHRFRRDRPPQIPAVPQWSGGHRTGHRACRGGGGCLHRRLACRHRGPHRGGRGHLVGGERARPRASLMSTPDDLGGGRVGRAGQAVHAKIVLMAGGQGRARPMTDAAPERIMALGHRAAMLQPETEPGPMRLVLYRSGRREREVDTVQEAQRAIAEDDGLMAWVALAEPDR